MLIVESMTRSECVKEIKYIYNYRMLKSVISMHNNIETIELQSYGIELERQDLVDGLLTGIERNVIRSISPDRHKVHNLLRLLYDNEVSPIHLVDVLGDKVDEYIIDFDDIVSEKAMV